MRSSNHSVIPVFKVPIDPSKDTTSEIYHIAGELTIMKTFGDFLLPDISDPFHL